MSEYLTRADVWAEVSVTRDDVAGITRVDVRDRCGRTIIELPDVHGPDLTITLANQLIRCVDGLGYGREVITPETLAKSGGAA